MSNLIGRKPKDTFTWLLHMSGPGPMTGGLRNVVLGDGTATPLNLTSTGVYMGTELVAIDSAVPHKTGTETIGGAKTLTGQLELTGQAATNPTSAMTKKLVSLDRLTTEVREWLMTSGYTDAVSGGMVGHAGNSASPGDVLVDSGTTAGGFGIFRWGGGNSIGAMLSGLGDDPNIVRFADRRHRIAMKFWLDAGYLIGDGIVRFWSSELYNRGNAGAASVRGFGFKVTTGGLYLMVHDGTTLATSSSPASVSTGVMHLLELEIYGGVLTAKLDGTALTSLSGGPTTNSVVLYSTPHLSAYTATGGGGNRARFVARDVRSLVTSS